MSDLKPCRVQAYLANEAAAREALKTFPQSTQDRLRAWQEKRSEWFNCTLLEIIAEFIDESPDPSIAELEAQLAECAETFDLFAKDLAEENADLHAQRIAVAEMMRDATLSKIGDHNG